MSQAGPLDAESSNPQIPTSFITDDGVAVPINNQLELLAEIVPNAGIPFQSTGVGNVVTYELQYADETAVTDATKVGVAAFDSASFAVDANGFVTLIGGGSAVTSFDVQSSTAPGTDPVLPSGGGAVTISGAAVVNHAVVLETHSRAANAFNIEVQYAASSAISDGTLSGVAHFDSTDFSVNPAGFVTLNGAGAGQTITGDAGGALSPTLGNWNIIGGTGVTTSGAVSTLTINASAATPLSFPCDSGTATPAANALTVSGQLAGTVPVMFTIGSGATIDIEDRTWISSLVVDPSATVGLRGTYTTITSALAAASSGQTIYVRPGNYVENITLVAGVDICAMAGDGYANTVQIRGSITCTYAGRASISGCQLISGASDGITVSGASATILTVKDCVLSQAAGAGTHYSVVCSAASGEVYVWDSFGTTDAFGAWFNVSNGNVVVNGCNFQNNGGSSLNNLVSGGNLRINQSIIGTDSTIGTGVAVSAGTLLVISSNLSGVITTSGTAVISVENSRVFVPGSTAVTVDGSGAHEVYGSELISDSASAVSVASGKSLNLSNCTINSTNTNAITGAGTINYGGLIFTGSSSLMNTTTQVPLIKSNDAIKVKSPGAYPYTTVPQDALILVDTSSARTITPLANPTTGQVHIIKDNVGSAGTNNITITPSGKNIDGAASYVMNVNYGSVNIVYNGTEWSIV